jgi:hypothetical protein
LLVYLWVVQVYHILNAYNPFAFIQKTSYPFRAFSFGIDADEWLCAGKADKQPGLIGEQEAKAVGGIQLGYSSTSYTTYGTGGKPVYDCLALAFGNMGVYAVIIVRADFAIKVVQELGWALAGFHHEVEEVKTSKDAISLWDVATETIATAFLAANDGFFAYHQRSDIFEPHSRLIDRNAKNLS